MRPLTLLAVAAVAAVAVASVTASLVGGGESAPAPVTTEAASVPTDEPAARIPGRERLAAELREAGVRGTLFFSDPADDCRVHGIHLPDLGAAPPPDVRSCRFELAPGRAVQSLGDAVWSPDGRLAARESRPGTVEVLAAGGPSLYELAGRAPAWRPDGTLTVARRGALVGYRLPCSAQARRCARTIVGPRALAVIARYPAFPRTGRIRVVRAGWLSESRVVLVLASGLGELVTVAEGGRLVSPPSILGAVSRVRVSPKGRFVALTGRGPNGLPAVTILDRDGALVTAQLGSPEARAVAWSPDGRWTAVATGASVLLMPTDQLALLRGGRQPRTLVLPVATDDLAWR